MKKDKFLIIILVISFYGCISKKYIYIQNRTIDDIYLMDGHNSYVLKPDSLFFLSLIYGKKSKDSLVSDENVFIPSVLKVNAKNKSLNYTKKNIVNAINANWQKNKGSIRILLPITDSLFIKKNDTINM